MYFIIELFVFTITMLVIFVYFVSYKKPKNFPPGPRGLPFIGSLLQIDESSHRYFKHLSEIYGSSIVSVKLGTKDIVVINDFKSMKEAFVKKNALFSARPEMFILKASLKDQDIISGWGTLWKERRQFTLHHLRDMGIGKRSMEYVIMEEVNKTIEYIEHSENNLVEITHLLFTPILSVISRITTGLTFEVNDAEIRKLSSVMKFNFECFKNDSPLNFMPYLRFVPGLTNFAKFMASHEEVENILKSHIERHMETYMEGEPRDFIDCYLAEIFKGHGKSTSEYAFQKENLLGILYNLYNAGVETTASTLSFGLMYMAIWPEIQSKVQAELDQVIGNGRFPTYMDRNLLPYTEATIMEILRYSTSLPLSLPHAPTTTAELNGFTIPKGTYVIQNIWAVHLDKDLWELPDLFRPERFLDDDGNVEKPEYFIPFSMGSRFCLGEALARMELFLFFACLIQRFSFQCITGERPPDMEPIVGATQRPRTFSLVVKLRY